MTIHEGGCICGAVRYAVSADPHHVTTCHCRFCQKATGTAYMVEFIFRLEDFRITKGNPATYDHRSEGSGMLVHIHFCPVCGTKVYLTLERSPENCGVYAGTFDDPNWFEIGPDNSRHIYIEAARHETILPPGIKAYRQHVRVQPDGPPLEPEVFDEPKLLGALS